jgi:hypothetical protein
MQTADNDAHNNAAMLTMDDNAATLTTDDNIDDGQ